MGSAAYGFSYVVAEFSDVCAGLAGDLEEYVAVLDFEEVYVVDFAGAELAFHWSS